MWGRRKENDREKCCLRVGGTPLLSPGNAGLVGLTERTSGPGHIGVRVNVRGQIGRCGHCQKERDCIERVGPDQTGLVSLTEGLGLHLEAVGGDTEGVSAPGAVLTCCPEVSPCLEGSSLVLFFRQLMIFFC